MPASHSFVSIAEDHVVLTAIKKAETGDDLLIRFYEWAGRGGNITLTVPESATAATLANLMEKPEAQQLPIVNGHLTIPVTPYQIQTVRIAYPPSAAP